MAVGVAILGVAVSVVTWGAGPAPAPEGGSVLPTSLVGTVGDNNCRLGEI